MRVRTSNRWQARPAAIAMAMPYPPALEVAPMREKLAIVRDTLIVLCVQAAFRASMLLRRFNY
jgi:hypothetical protein